MKPNRFDIESEFGDFPPSLDTLDMYGGQSVLWEKQSLRELSNALGPTRALMSIVLFTGLGGPRKEINKANRN